MALSLNLGNIVVHLRADTLQFQRSIKAAEAVMMGASRRIAAMATRMSLAVTAPVAIMAATSIKAFSKFDDAMTKSLAIMGDVSDGMKLEMENTARTMAKNGVTSATDLAESYFFLASAGLDAKASISALAVVEQFSVAGAFNMAVATDLLTDAQTALGISSKDPVKNQKEMLRLSDALVKANTLANASVEQFSRALTTKSATALRTVGKELEEGIAILAAYADAGIKANNAGEQLNILFRELQRGSLKQTKNWKALGVSTFDAAGEMRNTSDIIKDLEDRMEGMSDKQVRMTLSLLGFQSRSISAITPLVGMSDKLVEFEKRLKKAGGTTEDVAKKQLKSFVNQMKITWNQISDIGITIGRILMPMILKAGEAVRKATKAWEGLSKGTQKFIVQMGLVLALIGPVLFIVAKVLALGGFLLGIMGSFASFLPLIGGAIAAVVSFGAAIATFLISPLGILIGLLGVLAGVILNTTGIGGTALYDLSATFQQLGNVIAGVAHRTSVTFGAIASAISGGNIIGAVKVLWAQIQMEWARGVNGIAQITGDMVDATQKLWDFLAGGVVSTFQFAFNMVLKNIESAINGIIKLAELAIRMRGKFGTKKSTDKRLRELAIIKDATSGSIKRFRESGDSALENNASRRAQRASTRIPFAERAAEQLETATKAWTDAVGTIAKAEEDNRAKIAAPEKDSIEKLTKERTRLSKLKVQAGEADVTSQSGAFFSAQLQGVGGADIQSEKQVQLDQLLEMKNVKVSIDKGNELMEENAGVLTVG